MDGSSAVIEINDLVVEYGKGTKVHRAVNGVSFKVMPGECIGFIGANGAGKSTTMKAMMGFLFPHSGSIRIFGQEAGNARCRARTGYLPEVALYYPFMKARELLELYGGLHGLNRSDLRAKIPPLLEKVGLGGKAEVLLRNFSKGMQQRLGIAQALIADPELLVLDEVSSGLDPLGRYDLRQVLLELKRAGRTIFFSSHELSEVESLCDRVILIHKGQVVKQAGVAELMKPLNQYEITVPAKDSGRLPDSLRALESGRDGEFLHLRTSDVDAYAKALTALSAAGVPVHQTSSKTRSLEEYFIEVVGAGGKEPAS